MGAMRIGELLGRSARLHAEAPAVRDAGGELSFADLERSVRRLAAQLAGLGVAPGERVGILSRNRWEYVALYFAVAERGAVAVPLNWRLRRGELGWILEDAQVSALFADRASADELAGLEASTPALRAPVCLDDPPPGWLALRTLPEAEAAPHAMNGGGDAEVAVQMYTSGTTGRPKGAMLTPVSYTHLTLPTIYSV